MYFDGSHYIGIPKKQKPSYVHLWENLPEFVDDTDSGPGVFWYNNGKRQIPLTEANQELPNEVKFEAIQGEQLAIDFDAKYTEPEIDTEGEFYDGSELLDVDEPKKEKQLTLKDIFNELYRYAINLPKKERKEFYRDNLLPFFDTEEDMRGFIAQNLDRKKRNLIVRRIRMTRKANLADFNYFCTFTYDSNLHDEASFKKKLKTCFRHLCERRGWKYMGVWERGDKTDRLHFHGLFNIPDGEMVGMLFAKRDYNFSLHQMRTTYQNLYFNERFGRSDFEHIDNIERLGSALQYLMKYIEKTGEKIVYSKGLPQYLIVDICEDDVATRIGIEDRKLLLFDNFACYKDQQYVGMVNKQTISKLPTSN